MSLAHFKGHQNPCPTLRVLLNTSVMFLNIITRYCLLYGPETNFDTDGFGFHTFLRKGRQNWDYA